MFLIYVLSIEGDKTKVPVFLAEIEKEVEEKNLFNFWMISTLKVSEM